ncbi:uncharacterized protein LAESUDRAFT_730986 [Laetiporus sulphureus 93-53]|uniref:Phosphatidate cytidylyltransferase n=1 Tax=Laetiporus sulphureus 93-53 TaxID=1314785 RepID=A0A165BSF0_9APHY|nr:uncharacterized protein LAESUDRAFT_730986 [Laetiporus sulphureus 93-53]KZT01567.1 hypothetical protein LAESUDRAFT_730986 [Laetiporus sulphureus 93-53]
MSTGLSNGHSPDSQPDKHPPAASELPPCNRKLKQTEAKKPGVSKIVDWEIPRKTLHSSIGFLTLYLYVSNGSARNVVVVLTAGLAIIVPCDILRLRSAQFERVYERAVGFLMRESEKKSTNGVIWYILGVIFALSVYPLDIAVVSILILSWADTAASTFGRLWGSRTPSLPRRLPILGLPLATRKSLAGFIAAALTGAFTAIGFWGWVVPTFGTESRYHWIGRATANHGSSESVGGWFGLAVLGVVSGLISGVAEALDLDSLDDNLTLPIISGGCLWGFFKLLDLFTSW